MAGNLNILLELTKIHIPLRTAGLFEQISSRFFEPSKQTAYFKINYTLSALCMAKRVFTGFRGKKSSSFSIIMVHETKMCNKQCSF